MSSAFQYGVFDEQEGGGRNIDYTAIATAAVQLLPGRHSIVSTTDCWIRRGGATILATVDNVAGAAVGSMFLPANVIFFFRVDSDQVTGNKISADAIKDYISIIRDAADGKAFIRKASR